MKSETHLAVFGDTHGHLRLMLQLCRLWQLQSQTRLDGVLQCGDLGFFPNPGNLDRATRRFAQRDPEELGFACFFALPRPTNRDPLLEKILQGDPDDFDTVRCPVVFCHGNHEDFAELERVTRGAALAPVDAFDRIHFLRSGETTTLAGVRVAALGGAPEDDEDADHPVLGQRVSLAAARRLRKREFDILLTHGAPRGIGGDSDAHGSAAVRSLIEACQPRYHFFGHHERPIPQATIGVTRCTWLNDTNFQRTREGLHNGPVEPGCMAVVRWGGEQDHEAAVIEARWFRELTGATWRHY